MFPIRIKKQGKYWGYSKVNVFKKVIRKFRYGTVALVLRDHLLLISIDFSPFYWVLEIAPDWPMPEVEGDFGDFTFEFFGEKEMHDISKIPGRNYPVERFLNKLESGHKCFGAKYKGEMAVYNWIEIGSCHERLNPGKLKDNEAYLYDMYTQKPFRGKNLAPYLRIKTYEALRSMGIDTCYSICILFNKPSIVFKQKLNARFVKLCLYLDLFKKLRWNWTLKTYKT